MIVNRLSVVMGERRLSIAEVAKLGKLAYNTVDNLYNDTTKGIDFKTLDKLCYVLECTPNDLFRYTESK